METPTTTKNRSKNPGNDMKIKINPASITPTMVKPTVSPISYILTFSTNLFNMSLYYHKTVN